MRISWCKGKRLSSLECTCFWWVDHSEPLGLCAFLDQCCPLVAISANSDSGCDSSALWESLSHHSQGDTLSFGHSVFYPWCPSVAFGCLGMSLFLVCVIFVSGLSVKCLLPLFSAWLSNSFPLSVALPALLSLVCDPKLGSRLSSSWSWFLRMQGLAALSRMSQELSEG